MRTNSYIFECKSCFFIEEEKHKFRDDMSEIEKILSAINPSLKINYIQLNRLNTLNSSNQKNTLYTLLPYEEINKEMNEIIAPNFMNSMKEIFTPAFFAIPIDTIFAEAPIMVILPPRHAPSANAHQSKF